MARSVFLLLYTVDPTAPDVADVIFIAVDSQTYPDDAAAVDKRRAPTKERSQDRLEAYLSTSDIVSLTALRMFSETKV